LPVEAPAFPAALTAGARARQTIATRSTIQIVVPIEAREAVDIRPGDMIGSYLESRRSIMKKIPHRESDEPHQLAKLFSTNLVFLVRIEFLVRKGF
jgi:hypothetical protein